MGRSAITEVKEKPRFPFVLGWIEIPLRFRRLQRNVMCPTPAYSQEIRAPFSLALNSPEEMLAKHHSNEDMAESSPFYGQPISLLLGLLQGIHSFGLIEFVLFRNSFLGTSSDHWTKHIRSSLSFNGF